MKVQSHTKFWRPDLSNIGKCFIGNHCIIHSHVWIGDGVEIGDHCRIQAFSFLPGGIVLHDYVFIGPRVTFTNDKRPPSGTWAKTLVKQGACIGAGAIILPGLTIGKYALIGAGAVVTKDVPDGETWVGNPARPLM